MDTPKPIAEMTDAELQDYLETALAALAVLRAARLRVITHVAQVAEEESD